MNEERNNQPQTAEPSLSEILQVRRDKLKALQDAGRNPFEQTRFARSAYSADIKEDFEAYDGKTLQAAGRIMSKRGMGKAIFCDIQDDRGQIQLYVRKDAVTEQEFADFRKYDIGDIIGVSGYAFKTKTGEISIHVQQVTLLSKSLRPLPEKFHGMTNMELRYRQRYVDLIMNPESKRNFQIRSRFVAYLRRYLDGLGFMEVETPVLSPIAGGATARPFITHHNTLDIDMYMRIATELPLKRLIVGGMDADGNDVTNDVSVLCCKVTAELKLSQPSLSVRWHKHSARRMKLAAAEVARAGIGMPAYFNDEAIIPVLRNIGYSLAEARDYCEVGCVEPHVAGRMEGMYSAGFTNLCKVLETTIFNGVDPIRGKQIGLAVGEQFEDFTAFYDAYRTQQRYFMDLHAQSVNAVEFAHSTLCPTPLVSCFVDDCIERGVDIRRGGAHYNYTSPNAVGLANLGAGLGYYPILLIITVILLIFGFFLEGIATVSMLLPLFIPIAQAVGIDLLHLGMIVTMTNVMGCMTPPVANNIFAASTFTGLPMGRISKGELPYLGCFFVVLLIVVFCPGLITMFG